jgi:hypothetical protein
VERPGKGAFCLLNAMVVAQTTMALSREGKVECRVESLAGRFAAAPREQQPEGQPAVGGADGSARPRGGAAVAIAGSSTAVST